MDALCKKFKIDYSLREKHTALLDCKLLTQVYIELINKRELLLDLNNSIKNDIINNHNITSAGIIIPISKEQKEEYNYRFLNIFEFDSVKFLLVLSSFYGLITTLLLLVSMIYINDNLKQLIPQAEIIIKTIMQINNMFFLFLP